MTRRSDTLIPATRTARTIYRYIRDLGYEAPGVKEYDVEICRTYAGHVQRSQGAWSWLLLAPNGYDAFYPVSVGSQYPATQIARHIRAGTVQHSVNDYDQITLSPGDPPSCTTST